MVKENIDDLCPASYDVFGLKKDKERICKASSIRCYAPRNYSGCDQYKIYKKLNAIKDDYKELNIV